MVKQKNNDLFKAYLSEEILINKAYANFIKVLFEKNLLSEVHVQLKELFLVQKRISLTI